jgi:drug/metabolite transporter (DMT)-like permease
MTHVATIDRRLVLLSIASAMSASLFFSINDTAIKFLSGGYALHQIVLFRSGIGLVVVLAFMLPFQGGFSTLRTKVLHLHLLRAAFVVTSNLCFFLGLAALPLANAVALFFVAPLLITALSVPILGETVGPRRWAAVGVGMLGVIVMLQPGTGLFQPAMLLPLFAASSYAMLHMMTRKMGGTETALTMTFYTQFIFAIVCIISGLALGHGAFANQDDVSLAFLLRAWKWPAQSDLLIFVVLGIASTFGGFFISQAYRNCAAAIVAPFEYIAMPLAIVWGLLVFGEWPEPFAWIGIALICGAGLFVVWRETRANPMPPHPAVCD